MAAGASQVLEQCLASDPALREEWQMSHKLGLTLESAHWALPAADQPG
jgi:hypothetical protein